MESIFIVSVKLTKKRLRSIKIEGFYLKKESSSTWVTYLNQDPVLFEYKKIECSTRFQTYYYGKYFYLLT